MKHCWLVLTLAGCVLAQTKDLDKLQGTWNITSVSTGADQLSAAMLRNAKIVIARDHFVSSGMGAEYEGTLELDAAASPKNLTMHFTAGPEQGNINRGIYELDGDQWRLCLNTSGGARPTSLAADSGAGIVLEVLRRASAATPLEGEWSMVSGTSDGRPLPDAYLRMGKRVVKGNEMSVMFGSEVYSKGTFTVDKSAIDIHNTAGAFNGKDQLGIYERSGSTLKLSIAVPGRDRPTDFTAGEGRTVVTWTLTSPQSANR